MVVKASDFQVACIADNFGEFILVRDPIESCYLDRSNRGWLAIWDVGIVALVLLHTEFIAVDLVTEVVADPFLKIGV